MRIKNCFAKNLIEGNCSNKNGEVKRGCRFPVVKEEKGLKKRKEKKMDAIWRMRVD